eukprot:GHUV01016972.1.p1 GENE.GHUV01016972.1~~GHUV01016972.1.p1  ORF type:complete len:123 (-),score=5.74 GHUV01016972.1:1075-1443(-)
MIRKEFVSLLYIYSYSFNCRFYFFSFFFSKFLTYTADQVRRPVSQPCRSRIALGISALRMAGPCCGNMHFCCISWDSVTLRKVLGWSLAITHLYRFGSPKVNSCKLQETTDIPYEQTYHHEP